MSPFTAIDYSASAAQMAILFALFTGRIDRRTYWASWTILSGILFLKDVAQGDTVGAVVTGLVTAVSIYFWWRNRRKGGWKGAVKELGAKSRARVEALVEQMTPSPIPSPAGAR